MKRFVTQLEAELDPVTLEIYWNRLITIMDETDRALVRTAFSTVIGEGRDFAVILLDERGISLAQSVLSSTGFTVMLPRTTRSLLEVFPPETLREGDVLITNDPWLGTGHLLDVVVVRPVFRGWKPVAYIAAAAHISDIGGTLSYFEARDVYEEGLQVPPSKLYKAGEANEDLFRVIRANVRVPELVIGDLHAIVAAEYVGATRLHEFLEDYGLGDLRGVSGTIQGKSEAAMRAAIAAIPDGAYRGHTRIDGHRYPLDIYTMVTVLGEQLCVDFAGTSPQVKGSAINGTLNATLGDVLIALKCALVPEVPNNEALFRPVEVRAPEGSVVNCTFPAPVKGRSTTTVHTHQALWEALAVAIPDKVQAGSGSFWIVLANGVGATGRPFSAFLSVHGGKGALWGVDGLPAISFPTNSSVTPVEAFENACPLQIERKELLCDSGGPGQYRGGLGQRVILRSVAEGPVVLTLRPVKRKYPAPGLAGGQPGAVGRILLDGQETEELTIELESGQEITLELPGGGGFGRPEEREAERVRHDVAFGYVSPEAAQAVYGMTVHLEGLLLEVLGG